MKLFELYIEKQTGTKYEMIDGYDDLIVLEDICTRDIEYIDSAELETQYIQCFYTFNPRGDN